MMRITHSAGFNLPFPPISHSPGVLEPSLVTDNVSKLNFLMKEPENTFKDSINIQLKKTQLRARSHLFADLDGIMLQHPFFYQVERE